MQCGMPAMMVEFVYCRRARALLLAWFVALAAPLTALAQAPQATLTGTVSDAHDQSPVAGATVTLEEAARSVTTGTDGRFSFDNLAPGTYHLRITATRFTPQRIE